MCVAILKKKTWQNFQNELLECQSTIENQKQVIEYDKREISRIMKDLRERDTEITNLKKEAETSEQQFKEQLFKSGKDKNVAENNFIEAKRECENLKEQYLSCKREIEAQKNTIKKRENSISQLQLENEGLKKTQQLYQEEIEKLNDELRACKEKKTIRKRNSKGQFEKKKEEQ